jgi:phage portal protein BeeE
MSFFGRVKTALFGGRVQAPYQMFQGLFQSGQAPRRGSKEMLEAYKRLPWLHAVVRRISTDIAPTEWKLYAPVSRSTEKSSRVITRDATGQYLGGKYVEVEQHPFLDVLAKPNPVLGKIGTFFVAQALLEVKGEVPVVLERGSDGLPLELWPVPPTWLQAGPSVSEDYWRFSYSGWYANIPTPDVLFMREPDLTNPYGRGIGTGDALADELDIDEFAAQHLKSWFYNRALPDAFLSVEGLTGEKEAQRFEEKLRQKHQGVGKGNQIHVSNGKIDVKMLSQTFKEQQLAETRGTQRDTILQVYNVPPEIMGIIENSNRATIDAAFYLYARGVLVPRMCALAGWLTTLAQEWDAGLVVGFSSPVPEDRAFELEVMSAQPSLFTKNEWRSMASKQPVEGWDEEFVDKPVAPSFGPPALPAGDDEPEPKEPVEDEPMDEDEEKAKRGRLLPLRPTRSHAR